MKPLQIESMNKEIDYQTGKIFWQPNKGYTSLLIQNLYDIGYRASTSGIMHYLNDNEGIKVCESYSWEGLLLEAAKTMA
jgi:hypothetical protein